MIKSELAARIAEQNPHLNRRDVEILVNTILDRITQALAEGDRVELRDFGVFSTHALQARPGRDPRTGSAVEVAARTNIRFKPSRTMRTRLNPVEICPEQGPAALRRAP
jgi:integration host factor subunit beta